MVFIYSRRMNTPFTEVEYYIHIGLLYTELQHCFQNIKEMVDLFKCVFFTIYNLFFLNGVKYCNILTMKIHCFVNDFILMKYFTD